MREIYLDNAATTRIAGEVLEAMMPYLTEVYANPSALHAPGRRSREAIDRARGQAARAIGARSGEIYFTSGGTEADNWAIRGAAYARRAQGRHLITSAIEHHAVLGAMAQLEREGFTVTYLPVDSAGLVDPAQVERAIREDTTLLSVMMANNEIGTVQPIREMAGIARARGVLVHTDAVQAVGAVPIDVRALGVDMLSLSAHKFHGPKGVGALYVRQGVVIDRLLRGGAQERGQRAGTENLAAIVGLGAAIERATRDIPAHAAAVRALRDELIRAILERVPHARLNGDAKKRLPGNVNMAFPGAPREAMLLNLDARGIAASAGSACTAGSLDLSHVLTAMGLGAEAAGCSVRFSVDEDNTPEEMTETAEAVGQIVGKLRAISGGR